jgi:RHS repeat-associated protein
MNTTQPTPVSRVSFLRRFRGRKPRFVTTSISTQLLTLVLIYALFLQFLPLRAMAATNYRSAPTRKNPVSSQSDQPSLLSGAKVGETSTTEPSAVLPEPPNAASSITDAVISRHKPTLNSGRIDGTLRVLLPESFTLNGNTQITSDLFLPGSPAITTSGGSQYGGTVSDNGSSTPSDYTLTLSGGISLPGKIHTQVDAIQLPDFPNSVPPASGTRTVSVNSQSAVANIGNWQTVRDLNVTGSHLNIDVPPGNYGTFTVNGNSQLRLSAGTYNFANTFNLDGSATVRTTGLVTINVGKNLIINSGAVALGSYTSPGNVAVNVLGAAVNINGSSQVTGLLHAYNATATISGTAQVRGQVIANALTLNGSGKIIGAVWPAYSTCATIFGPRRFDRTIGPPNQYVEQFSLPSGFNSPFTLHIQNGSLDGTQRVSSATLKLNGVDVLSPSDLNQNVASLDRNVNLTTNNQLDVRVASDPGSYLLINLCGTVPVSDTTAPALTITSPLNDSTTTQSAITVNGTAIDNGAGATGVAHVYVNDVEASYNSATNTWTIANVALALDENQIVVRALDQAGNQSTATVNVIRQSPVNLAPVADAGTDQTLTLPNTATLHGTASDDGQPEGSTLTTVWSKVSGPGTVTFGDAAALITTASFELSGTYVLRLTASDSALTKSDDLTVTVQPQNQPPTVSAGPDQMIALPHTATLNGTVTDDGLPAGSTVTTTWSQVSGPSPATFDDATLPDTNVTFSAPGTYVFRLTASDGELSARSDVTITVNPENQAPTVSAGQTQTISLPNATAALNGSATDDGWPYGSSLVVSWSAVSGPGPVVFDNPNSANTVAHFTVAGPYLLRLTATDGELTNTSDVTITVTPPNQAPTANAGSDQSIVLPGTASLNGTVGDDGLPLGSSLATLWSQVSGPGTVTFANPNVTVTTASFSVAGTYVLRLTASDSQLYSSDDLTITVDPENQPPVVNAGPDQTITLPASANLNGSVTDDGWPRGSSVSVLWTKLSGPGDVNFSNPNSPTTAASFSQAGPYVLRLTASDSQATATDDIDVIVIPENHAPTANGGADQHITLPSVANLTGSVGDDGLPSGSTLASTWSKVSGPGTVTFGNPNAPVTTATFSVAGNYVLRLTANDSQLSASDEITIIVDPENQPPTVNAGADQTVTLPNVANLNGTVSDDGIPVGSTITTNWSQVIGPASATFFNTGAPVTIVTFSQPGTYVLRLTASDSALTSIDDVQITVNPTPNQSPSVNAGSDQSISINGNLLVNAGNDEQLVSGKITGWTEVLGTWTQGTVNTAPGFPEPRRGSAYFFAGNSPQAELRQDVDVSAFSSTINSGTQQFALRAYIRSLQESFPDLARVIIEYRDPTNTNVIAAADSASALLNSSLSDEFNDTAIDSKWTRIGTEATMSEGAGSLHVSMASLTTDKANMLVQPIPAGDWEMVVKLDNQAAYRNYNSSGLLIAGDVGGNPSTAGIVTYQDAHFATNAHYLYISKWVNRFTFGGDLASAVTLSTTANPLWQKIVKTGANYTFWYSTNGINFVQAGGTISQSSFGFTPAYIGLYTNNANTNLPIDVYFDSFQVSVSASTDAWHLFEDTRTAPAGTGWIRVRLLATRNSGATNDAFFDSVSLRPVGNAAVKLAGSATDDGLPSGGTLSSNWSLVSGLGNVLFTNAQLPTSGASFDTPGTYLLRLTANDGQLSASDDVSITVNPANQPPVVNAGANQTIAPPASANLNGTVTDDGQPSGSSVSVAWSKLSGPGSVTFGNNNSAATTASFSAPGTYVLRLTADDSDLDATADVTITVAVNQPPTVNAGADQTIALPTNTVSLNGAVTDDGLPAGSVLTSTWSVVNGPGTVTFGNVSSVVTTAAFSGAGTYVLRLTTSDSALSASDDVQIVVTPENHAPTVSAGPDQEGTWPEGSNANAKVFLMDLNGNIKKRLTFSTFDDYNANWSPQNNRIVLSSNRDGNNEIYVMDADGQNQTRLTNSAAYEFGPYWSPDGTKIIYTSNEFGHNDVFVMNADGSNKTRLTTTAAENVGGVWRPKIINGQVTNGDEIVFTTSRDGNRELYAMDPDGSNQRRLTNNPGQDDAAVWLPDGSALGFSSKRSGDSDLNIYLMNPDGSNVRRVLDNPGDDFLSDWSRDGAKLTWVNTPGGNADVYIANADGSQVTRLTSFAGEDTVPNFSPDGQQLVMSSRRDGVYLAGSVADDGLPAGTLSVAWSKLSGPGTVTFDSPTTAKTQAKFGAPGTYVLRLTANDSALSASDEVTITITENHAPSANAGADQTINSCTANLQGVALDDGFPAGSTLAVSWSKLSGPGNVNFANAANLNTSAAFSLAGNYVLRLTVSDSLLTTTDDLAISVTTLSNAPPSYFDPTTTTYLSFQDSPFRNLSTSYFYNEDFEDHLLNTPGVTADAGGVTSVIWGSTAHDSVDADDGVIDGSGANGDCYYTFNGNAGVKFTFNASVLGSLPTHAGLVWTDGAGTVSFEAFDRNGVSMGVRGPFNLPDSAYFGATAEDRFLGAYNPQGISAIRVLNTSGGLEVDHLQYGFGSNANAAPVVNAGADQTLILPITTATLNGTVTDDGLPGCATLTYSWSQVSGPGTVTFAHPNALNTTATFSVVGTYVLRLTANDSALSSSDEVTMIASNAQPPLANFVVPESTGTAGAFVIASSGFTSSAFSGDKLLDDSNFTFWNAPGSTNQFVTLQFFDQQNVYIDRVRMQSNQGSVTPSNVKDFDVKISSTTSDDASFVTVLSATMLNNGKLQEFVFPGGLARAKYLKFVMKNNYGTAGSTTLATFNPVAVGSADSLLSLPGQSNVALSQSPALPLNGGTIYSSSYDGGTSSATNLIGYFAGGWQISNTPGQFAIIQLAGGKSYTIEGVRLATWYDSGYGFPTGVKDFEVWVSNTTPDDISFTKVLTATAPFVPNTTEFLFPGGPVQARFVKYVPLTNGNNGTTINTQSFDVMATGTARVVGVSQEAAQYPNSASAAFDGVTNSNWIASGTVTNVWVKTALANDAIQKIYGVRIHPMSDISFQQGPKDFDIRVSTTTTDDSAFTTVYSGTVSIANTAQEFLFSNFVDARYVQFFWKNAYHSSVLGVRELEVLAAPERGSGIVSFSAGAGSVGTLLDLDPTNQPWITPNNQNTNISVKLVLPRAELTTLSHIALRPAIAFNGNYTAPKDFLFQVSTTDSADASFTTAFAGTLINSIQLQDFYFAPVQAKYVRLVLLKGPTDFGSYGLHNFLIYSSTTIGTTTRFVDRSSDPDGQVVSWAWNFGDGTTSTLKDPVHTFAQPGDYTVSLTVTDNNGLSNSYSSGYRVVESINPELTISPMIAHEGGESVRFMDVQKLLLMPTALRTYDFGDGSPLYTQYSNSSLYTYPDSGVFHVTLKVGDSLGVSQTSTRDITVLNLPPSVDIDPGKTLVWGESWTSVPRITDQSPVDRLTLQGQWVFGDGQTSQCVNCTNANATVTRAYAHPGTYHAVLTVTDKDGGASSDSADFIINKRPTAFIFQNPPAQTEGQPLVIQAQLMDTFANQALIGKPVQFKLNGASFNTVTGANGIAQVSVPLPAGTRIDVITGSFAEDEYYLSGGGVTVPPTAGGTPPASSVSHQGTNFWLMFPYAYFSGSLPVQTLYLTSPVATTGTVTIPGINFTQNFTVQANTVLTMQLPFTMVYENNTVTAKGIHVVSQQPVSIYGLDRIGFSSDAFLGLPVTALGMDYYILTYSNMGFAPSSELGVVATENSTVVTITPSVTSSGHAGGVPFNVTLNQGQTYLLQNLDPTAQGDLSGSRVTANKPIGVYAGHEAATIPAEAVCCADHLVEQLPPTGAWGKRFATIPLATRTKGDFFRMIAAEDGTAVYLNGSQIALLNRGQWVERIVKTPAEIIATAPIMVTQYSTSIYYDPPTSGKADPFTMTIPPYSQFLNHYTITTPATGFQFNYANVVAPTASLGSITLDGTPIPASSFAPIGVSGYSGAQVTIPIGSHNFDGPVSFGVFVYGYNQDEGYGYPGGMNMSPTVQSTNVAVTPETSSRSIHTQSCVVATVTNQDQYPLGGRTINFTVTGANPSSSSTTTDAAGQAPLCYTGTNVGSDLVTAAVGPVSGTASIQWQTNVPNQAPVVSAGPDQTITLPAPASLQGSATDDGLPANSLNVAWSKVSGPGNVVFTNPSAAVTSATFDAAGAYVLRLTATDTSLTTTDDVAITVNPIPTNQPPTANAGPDQSAAVKGNLIVNPGNEEPLVNGEIPGWTEVQGTTWTQGNSSTAGFDAHRGQYFFYVGADGAEYAELRQDVDVSAFAAAIATGAQQFEFQTFVRSAPEFPYPDHPGIVVEFRNAQNTGVLATMEGGNGYAINSWPLTETIQAAPVGTGWIRVRLIATRSMAGLNDAYFDSVSLRPIGSAAVKLTGAVTDDGLPYGSNVSANWTKLSGPGAVTFSNANAASSGASFTTPGTYVLRLTGSDGQATTTDDVTITVYAQNQPPVVSGGNNQSITLPAGATLNGVVNDDGLPNGSSVSKIWRKDSGPGIVSFANPNAASTTATFSTPGFYALILTADDSEYSANGIFYVNVNPAPAPTNEPPAVNPGPNQTISLPADTVTLNGTVTDDGLPAGSTLAITWSKVSGPGAVTFGSPNSAVTTAQFSAIGSYVLRLSASDGAYLASHDVAIILTAQNFAPTVNAGPDQTTVLSAGAQLNGTASDDGLPAGSNLTTTWSKVSGPGNVTFLNPNVTVTGANFSVTGTYVLRLTANDGGLSASDDLTIIVNDNVPAPTVQITSPSDDVSVTEPTNITGTVSGGAWVVEYSLDSDDNANSRVWTQIASGNGPVSGTLGRLDPTMMLNGLFDLRLTATDSYGQSSWTKVSVIVERNLKIGNFNVSFTDLSIPVAGVPMEVTRTYDSRDKRIGDFGFGWSLGLHNIRVEKSSVVGLKWYETVSQEVFPNYCLEPVGSHTVTVTFPGGKVFKFQPKVAPHCQRNVPITTGNMSFTPMVGTVGKLEVIGSSDVQIDGSVPGPLNLIGFGGGVDIFNSFVFKFTAEDGTAYVIDQRTGLQSMSDTSGNTLTIGPNGIVHSSGKSIVFHRDIAGRIDSITDPNGNSMFYQYDEHGDLISYTDNENHTSTYTYDSNHRLLTIKDPRNIQPIRNDYDPDGRLIRHTDAFGKVITYIHDIPNRTETVKDRFGYPTVFEYDERGNVLKKTDARGGATSFTYDANDNVLTTRNALGKTTTYTYDENNHRTSITDPLNNVTQFTYNAIGKVLTMTDARHHVTTNTYDTAGKLKTTTDPLNNTTSYIYTVFGGQVISMTDSLDKTTHYEYSGNYLTKVTDALGHEATFTYDANGNRASQTVVRTNAQGQPESITTNYEYDKLSRLKKTIYSDGSFMQVEYNAIGQVSATIDQLGRRSDLTYDDMGRLTKTTYPDATFEEITYDAEGHRLTSRDRAGQLTSYTYDEVGRLIRTTFADGTFTQTLYDAAGQVLETTDARGNVTHFFYDDAGRRTKVRNALTQETTFTYDANGNQLTMTDALSHTLTNEYDLNNRRTKTIYADGSFDSLTYDAVGRSVSRTDQAGKTTQFTYDALDRLTKLKDALNQETTYAYDEIGEQISQTDANSHTTRFEYDHLGRRVKRILPAGEFETYSYDSAGNLLSKTDFKDKTTTFTYDVMHRLLSKVPDASLGQPAISFTYNASGQRATMTDASGSTIYSYDTRHRLSSKQTPFGTLSYTYDDRGNLLTTRSSNANGVSVDYGYDSLNRLATVKDNNLTSLNGGVSSYTYDNVGNLQSSQNPNGITTSYAYNSLNRLTTMTVGTGAANLASYSYTLGAAGNRTAVTELSGRTVHYTYDDLYRLTGESIAADPHGANGSVSYSYDAVGNRLNRTSSLVALPSQSSTYDANDRLTSDSYDNNGNTTSSSGNNYAYDFENHLTSLNGGNVTYGYDGDGNRVSKSVAGVTTNYLVDTNNPTTFAQVVEELQGGSVVRSFTYGHDRISQRIVGGAVSFYQYDGHGSVRQLTDAAATVTDQYDYDAFGNLIYRSGNTPNDYLYCGEQFDANIGFYYLRARYMNPAQGRFLSMDSYEGSAFEPVSLHKYLYAGNSPVNLTDPSGNSFMGEIGALASRAVLASMSMLLRAAVFITLNFTKIVEVIGAIEFGLTALTVATDLLGQAAQFTAHRQGRVFTGQIGADGENEARRYLSEKGFDVKLSTQNNSGHGVDLIATNSKGDYCWFEVKTTTSNTPVTTPLALSEAQQDAENFIRTRLTAARNGSGAYSTLSSEARLTAGEALAEFESTIASGRTVKSFVSEVRFPLAYAAMASEEEEIEFLITFRRWWRPQ